MKLRMIAALLLFCAILLPQTILAEENEDALVIVLLANDGFKSAGAEFSDSLELLIRKAEADGKQVTVYGPNEKPDPSPRFVTGDVSAAALYNLPDYSNNQKTIQTTMSTLTEEAIAGKDVLLLVGHLGEYEIRAEESVTACLQSARSVKAIALVKDYLPNSDNSIPNAELTNILITRRLLEYPNTGTVPETVNGWLILDERSAIREYNANETVTGRLLSALFDHAGFTAEPVAEGSFIILPEIMANPMVHVTGIRAGNALTITAPDGQEWILQPDYAGSASPDLWSDPVQDNVTSIENQASPDIDLITLPENIEADPLANVDPTFTPNPTAVPSFSEPEKPFSIVWVADGTAALLTFDNATHGRWQITSNGSAPTTSLYYIHTSLQINEAIVQDAQISASAEGQVEYHLNGTFAKGQTYTLKITDNPFTTTGQLLTRYADALTLHIESEDASCTTSTGAEFTCNRSGIYRLNVRLMLYNRLLATQQYVVEVINHAPQVTGEKIAHVDGVYWDVVHSDGRVITSLEKLATDADGDTLTWSIAPMTGGDYGSTLDIQGIHLQIENSDLRFSWSETSALQETITFRLKAEDSEKLFCEQNISITPRIMSRELAALAFVPIDPAPASQVHAKGSEDSLCFRWEGSQEAIDFLQNQNPIITVGLEGLDETWTNAQLDQEKNCYTASICYPHQSDDFNILVHVQLNDSAKVPFESTYTYGTVKVGNVPPEPSQTGKSGMHVQIGLEATINVLTDDSFMDQDGDSLTYHITIVDKTPFRTAENGESTPNTITVLPYSYSPEDYGIWEVQVVAVDPHGETSEPLTLICIVATWYAAAAAGALALFVVLIFILIIRHFIKPSFPVDSQLLIKLKYNGKEAVATLHPSRWKQQPMPLDRLLTCDITLLITEDLCKQLGKILIKPRRKGFTLIDKTDDGLPIGSHDLVSFGEEIDLDVKELYIILQLQSNE